MTTQESQPTGLSIHDFEAFGRKVAQWARDDATQPKTFEELKAQLDGLATISAPIDKFKLVQSAPDTMLIRLPAKVPLERAEQEQKLRSAIPSFWFNCNNMSDDALFYSWIGDYSIAQCG